MLVLIVSYLHQGVGYSLFPKSDRPLLPPVAK